MTSISCRRCSAVRVTKAIQELAEEPMPPGARKLADVDAYRVRAGNYRVVYAVKDDRLVVLIVRVGHRRDVYKKMKTIRRRLEE